MISRIYRPVYVFTIKVLMPALVYLLSVILIISIIFAADEIADSNIVLRQSKTDLRSAREREFELRREALIINQNDYKIAIEKSNGGMLEDGEERIIVH